MLPLNGHTSWTHLRSKRLRCSTVIVFLHTFIIFVVLPELKLGATQLLLLPDTTTILFLQRPAWHFSQMRSSWSFVNDDAAFVSSTTVAQHTISVWGKIINLCMITPTRRISLLGMLLNPYQYLTITYRDYSRINGIHVNKSAQRHQFHQSASTTSGNTGLMLHSDTTNVDNIHILSILWMKKEWRRDDHRSMTNGRCIQWLWRWQKTASMPASLTTMVDDNANEPIWNWERK